MKKQFITIFFLFPLIAFADNPFGDAFNKSFSNSIQYMQMENQAAQDQISNDIALKQLEITQQTADTINQELAGCTDAVVLIARQRNESNQALLNFKNYIANVSADLLAVKKNPKLQDKFKSIYPEIFYPLLDLVSSVKKRIPAKNH
jgi:hypothetical protein